MVDRSEITVEAQSPVALQMQPILLKPADAARALGISERALWELSKKKHEIPYVDVGNGDKQESRRYLTEDLLAWARSRRNGQPPPAA